MAVHVCASAEIQQRDREFCVCKGVCTCTIIGCLHDPANVQQTSSKRIQNTRANAGRLLDRINTLL